MEIKYLSMDWLDKFSCIGAQCQDTCCAGWHISLTEEEIAQYKQLDHPFREELLAAVDEQEKAMKRPNGACALLTEDGWCKLVKACGDQMLSNTCTIFPRYYVKYGDILESMVEIVCPVVAEYLFDTEEIGFQFGKAEASSIDEIDYALYDNLSLPRSYLIDLIQNYHNRYAFGKCYIICSVMQKIQALLREGPLSREAVTQILLPYDDPRKCTMLLHECQKIADNYSQKARLFHTLIMQFQKAIYHYLPKLCNLDDGLGGNLKKWLADISALEEDLAAYTRFFRKNYISMANNYLVYILFHDWVVKDKEKFGQKMELRMIEFAFFQLFSMSRWLREGTVAKSDFVQIIVRIDRLFAHHEQFGKIVNEFLAESSQTGLGNILSYFFV